LLVRYHAAFPARLILSTPHALRGSYFLDHPLAVAQHKLAIAGEFVARFFVAGKIDNDDITRLAQYGNPAL
jgi:hypothetical protein